MNKKEYRIADLSAILGISEVAIRKKVKEGLYKQRYEVVTKLFNNKQTAFILLSDVELEEEKRIASANKNKFYGQKVEHNVEDNEIIEVEPENIQSETISENSYITFTKLYIDKLDNVYQTVIEGNKQLAEKDKQIYLLEDLSKREKQDMFELQATNKTLSMKVKRYEITLIILITVVALTSLPVMYILLKHFIH